MLRPARIVTSRRPLTGSAVKRIALWNNRADTLGRTWAAPAERWPSTVPPAHPSPLHREAARDTPRSRRLTAETTTCTRYQTSGTVAARLQLCLFRQPETGY